MIFCLFMLIVLTLHDDTLTIHVYAQTLSLFTDNLSDYHIYGMKIYHYNINIINIKEFRCSVHLIITFQGQMIVKCRRASVPPNKGGGVKNYTSCDFDSFLIEQCFGCLVSGVTLFAVYQMSIF